MGGASEERVLKSLEDVEEQFSRVTDDIATAERRAKTALGQAQDYLLRLRSLMDLAKTAGISGSPGGVGSEEAQRQMQEAERVSAAREQKLRELREATASKDVLRRRLLEINQAHMTLAAQLKGIYDAQAAQALRNIAARMRVPEGRLARLTPAAVKGQVDALLDEAGGRYEQLHKNLRARTRLEDEARFRVSEWKDAKHRADEIRRELVAAEEAERAAAERLAAARSALSATKQRERELRQLFGEAPPATESEVLGGIRANQALREDMFALVEEFEALQAKADSAVTDLRRSKGTYTRVKQDIEDTRALIDDCAELRRDKAAAAREQGQLEQLEGRLAKTNESIGLLQVSQRQAADSANFTRFRVTDAKLKQLYSLAAQLSRQRDTAAASARDAAQSIQLREAALRARAGGAFEELMLAAEAEHEP